MQFRPKDGEGKNRKRKGDFSVTDVIESNINPHESARSNHTESSLPNPFFDYFFSVVISIFTKDS